ncbi:hypothetical protein CCACVL1_27920 [Corchorus capsularis]|uniref:Uncharacterized protein n=1 Tax=Corchorus capsularis TaxID=210143 RepID=A0A1R3G8B1_COCAP|nr:hypothetical protein CCACVL1_27920 [Corchorus capsularis]
MPILHGMPMLHSISSNYDTISEHVLADLHARACVGVRSFTVDSSLVARAAVAQASPDRITTSHLESII